VWGSAAAGAAFTRLSTSVKPAARRVTKPAVVIGPGEHTVSVGQAFVDSCDEVLVGVDEGRFPAVTAFSSYTKRRKGIRDGLECSRL
jgi:hypothetical protein